MWQRLGRNPNDLMETSHARVGTAKPGASMEVLGKVPTPLILRTTQGEFILETQPYVLRDLSHDLNLSGPTLRRNNITHFHGRDRLQIRNHWIQLHPMPPTTRNQVATLTPPTESFQVCPIYAIDNQEIAPGESRQVQIVCPSRRQQTTSPPYVMMFGEVNATNAEECEPTITHLQNGYGKTLLANNTTSPILV